MKRILFHASGCSVGFGLLLYFPCNTDAWYALEAAWTFFALLVPAMIASEIAMLFIFKRRSTLDMILRCSLAVCNLLIRVFKINEEEYRPSKPAVSCQPIPHGCIRYKNMHVIIKPHEQDMNAVLERCDSLSEKLHVTAVNALFLVRPIIAFAMWREAISDVTIAWAPNKFSPEVAKAMVERSTFVKPNDPLVMRELEEVALLAIDRDALK